MAVGKCEYAAFDAFEEFFDYDVRAGGAEFPAEHLGECGFGLGECFGDNHAFACGEAVGLEHVGRGERFEEGVALVDGLGGEGAVSGCRDAVAGHEALGVVFARLKHGSGFFRADKKGLRGVESLEVVDDSCHEGVFIAHDNHVDCLLGDDAADGFEVEGRGVDVGAEGAGAAVAGGDVELVAERAAADFPCQCGFAAAAAEQKDIHESVGGGDMR